MSYYWKTLQYAAQNNNRTLFLEILEHPIDHLAVVPFSLLRHITYYYFSHHDTFDDHHLDFLQYLLDKHLSVEPQSTDKHVLMDYGFTIGQLYRQVIYADMNNIHIDGITRYIYHYMQHITAFHRNIQFFSILPMLGWFSYIKDLQHQRDIIDFLETSLIEENNEKLSIDTLHECQKLVALEFGYKNKPPAYNFFTAIKHAIRRHTHYEEHHEWLNAYIDAHIDNDISKLRMDFDDNPKINIIWEMIQASNNNTAIDRHIILSKIQSPSLTDVNALLRTFLKTS